MGLLTGVSTETDIFTQEWVDANKGVPESAMNCKIMLSRRISSGKPTWNPETGEFENTTLVEIFENVKARIQPLRSAVPKEVPGNDTIAQTMLVSYPITQTETVNVDDLLKVTDSPLNPDLLRYRMRVREVLDSGNPLERTVQCEVVVVI